MQTFSAVHSSEGGTHGVRIGNGKPTLIETVFSSITHREAVNWSIIKHHRNH